MRSPWFPQYAADYLVDIRIQRMSLEAQGAYARIRALMWVESDDASLPLDEKFFQKFLGISSHKWKKVWGEMMKKDGPVFHIEGDRITCHQLRKEKEFQREKSEKARTSAARRWDADARNAHCERNASAMRSQCSSHSQVQEEEKDPPTSPPATRVDGCVDSPPPPAKRKPRKRILGVGQQERFDRFYQAYPRRVDPGAAEKAWQAIDDGSADFLDKTFPAILAGAAGYSREVAHRPRDKIKHPATFLNARGWQSEFQPEPETPRSRYDEFDGTFTMPLRGGPGAVQGADGPGHRAGRVPSVPGGGGTADRGGGAAEADGEALAGKSTPAGGPGLGFDESLH